MELQNFFAQDVNGNIVPGAVCSLFLPDTTTLVTGLQDVNNVPMSNPFSANGNALVQFRAPNGTYDLKIEAGVVVNTLRITCADNLQALAELASFLGTHPTAPTVRTDSTPLQLGDRYFNSVDDLEYLYKSTGWEPNNLDGALIAAPGGSSLVGYTPPGPGESVTTVESKLREIVSVVDKGAIPGAVVNATAAFIAAGPGAYVPEGDFLVDADQLQSATYWGPGRLCTTGGAVIALQTDVEGANYAARYIMDADYGGHEAPIYDGAQFAPQGLAYHRDPVTGAQRMFISQSVGDGADWGPDEYVRITEFALREDGGVQPATVFTSPIRCSHAHLSALTDSDGKLYMYQSNAAPPGTINLNAGVGKGWSKVEWKGAATDTEVTNFVVWGAPGSGHRYQNYGKGCVQASQDGKYMILIGINYSPSSGGRTLFVYDRKQVESMANPLDAEPVYAPFPLPNYPADGGTAYQGETCDGRYVYVCWGTGAVFGRRGIMVYTLSGDPVRHISMDGVAGLYTNEQLFNGGALGEANAFEPEGITLRGDEIFVTYTDFWRDAPDVVTYEGLNYANIQIGNIGQPPNSDILHWKVTTRPATMGAWNAATTYGVGATRLRRKKIFSIRPAKGTPDEMPCVSTYTFPYSVAQYPGDASVLVNASFDFGATYRVCAHVVTDDSYRTAYDYRYGYTFAVFDQRAGSDNTVRAALRMSADSTSHVASVIAGDGTSAGGSSLNLFSSTSPSNPGSLRLNTAGVGDIRHLIGGSTKFVTNATENITYQGLRPLNTNEFALGSSSREYSDIFSVRGTFSGPVRIGKYTLATLPSAATFNGFLIDVTDATGGPKTCRSNGTLWQILNTTTTVS